MPQLHYAITCGGQSGIGSNRPFPFCSSSFSSAAYSNVGRKTQQVVKQPKPVASACLRDNYTTTSEFLFPLKTPCTTEEKKKCSMYCTPKDVDILKTAETAVLDEGLSAQYINPPVFPLMCGTEPRGGSRVCTGDVPKVSSPSVCPIICSCFSQTKSNEEYPEHPSVFPSSFPVMDFAGRIVKSGQEMRMFTLRKDKTVFCSEMVESNQHRHKAHLAHISTKAWRNEKYAVREKNFCDGVEGCVVLDEKNYMKNEEEGDNDKVKVDKWHQHHSQEEEEGDGSQSLSQSDSMGISSSLSSSTTPSKFCPPAVSYTSRSRFEAQISTSFVHMEPSFPNSSLRAPSSFSLFE